MTEFMELFDTHFHLHGEDDIAGFMECTHSDLLLAAKDFRQPPDRLLMLCAGSNYAESRKAMEFARQVKEGYFSCGVHPHDAEEFLANEEPDFAVFKDEEKLVAIGEIGLDYFYDYSDEVSQKKVMEKFLALALEWDLPAMLHLRDKENRRQAYADALAMLTDFAHAGGRFVIHCYAGNCEDAEKFLALGGYFGVTGMYTFKAAANIRSSIAMIPDEKLLIETDSPYLAPVPYRGRSNTPGMVALVAQALGADRQMTPEDAAQLFADNGKRFYGIK